MTDLILVTPDRFQDHRGFFSELYNRQRFQEYHIFEDFVQDNHSLSHLAGTLRGLHFQYPPFAQAKLVRCGKGSIFDVVVDLRVGSPNYGKWSGFELSASNGVQLFIPVGFAHGFLTLEPDSEIVYKCSNYYSPEHEGSILWSSCEIEWPYFGEPIISEKDRCATRFDDFISPFLFGDAS